MCVLTCSSVLLFPVNDLDLIQFLSFFGQNCFTGGGMYLELDSGSVDDLSVMFVAIDNHFLGPLFYYFISHYFIRGLQNGDI